MDKRLYLDTSAYLCILLGEAGHKKLLRETAGAELLSSVILALDTGRSLIRLSYPSGEHMSGFFSPRHG
jgi:PIN domain nuclease of toxin-antitoxin system